MPRWAWNWTGAWAVILATIQQTAGKIAVSSAVPHSGSFTISLTAAPTTKLKVAYFIIG